MKRTPLYEEHVKLGARMVDFAGWDLPVMYTSIIDEHAATRTAAGLFDVSHMGEILVKGAQAKTLLGRLIPTSMDRLIPGHCMYSCLCNERGGVVDDIFIFMIGEGDYYIVVNAATAEKDLAWINGHNETSAAVIDVSAETAKIDLQGPRAREIAARVLDDDTPAGLARFQFTHVTYGSSPMMVSHSGYTGEHGYEFFLPNANAVKLWTGILDAGRDLGLKPAGLGARDSLRLEAAYSLYGHEITDDISPIEAGIGWFVNSADDYIGKEILVAHKAGGAGRETVCIEIPGRGVPREGCAVYSGDDRLGTMTSAGFSPTLRKGIGLALVRRGTAQAGMDVQVEIRGARIPARVVRRPFYKFHD
ncbi:MAG: glycine cleavage system aminomethyltransferase GcvT [Spirochaetes bacterium]|nr:MAG: glycine cleavage system aminomethyltransferase GcvT [Spirochaetota bacterium]